MDDELNLYKLLIEYIGSPVKFSELNTLLRSTHAKKDYKNLLN